MLQLPTVSHRIDQTSRQLLVLSMYVSLLSIDVPVYSLKMAEKWENSNVEVGLHAKGPNEKFWEITHHKNVTVYSEVLA